MNTMKILYSRDRIGELSGHVRFQF